ncbi:hypothetical protein B0H16DRAFT_1474435, partial [Mycena metata]
QHAQTVHANKADNAAEHTGDVLLRLRPPPPLPPTPPPPITLPSTRILLRPRPPTPTEPRAQHTREKTTATASAHQGTADGNEVKREPVEDSIGLELRIVRAPPRGTRAPAPHPPSNIAPGRRRRREGFWWTYGREAMGRKTERGRVWTWPWRWVALLSLVFLWAPLRARIPSLSFWAVSAQDEWMDDVPPSFPSFFAGRGRTTDWLNSDVRRGRRSSSMRVDDHRREPGMRAAALCLTEYFLFYLGSFARNAASARACLTSRPRAWAFAPSDLFHLLIASLPALERVFESKLRYAGLKLGLAQTVPANTF